MILFIYIFFLIKNNFNLSWREQLDPDRDFVKDKPCSREERDYIYKWAVEYRKANGGGKIKWELLQPKIEQVFGKSRANNTLKNNYNSKKRQLERKAKAKKQDMIIPKEID